MCEWLSFSFELFSKAIRKCLKWFRFFDFYRYNVWSYRERERGKPELAWDEVDESAPLILTETHKQIQSKIMSDLSSIQIRKANLISVRPSTADLSWGRFAVVAAIVEYRLELLHEEKICRRMESFKGVVVMKWSDDACLYIRCFLFSS